MLQLKSIFSVISLVAPTIAQIMDNKPAFVAWSAHDVNDAECTGSLIYANYHVGIGICYTIDQPNAYTAQLVSTEIATITFFSDENCNNDAASAIDTESEVCTVAGYGSTLEYSVMFVSTDAGKRSLMEDEIKYNGVKRDEAWEKIRLMLKNNTANDNLEQRVSPNTARKLVKKEKALDSQEIDAALVENSSTEPVASIAMQDSINPEVGPAPRAVNTIYYLKCPGYAGGRTKLSLCVNGGAHCDDNGNLISNIVLGSYGSCSVLCRCNSYIYHDEFKKRNAADLEKA